MLIPILRQLLIFTAILLTVTGSLTVCCGTDGAYGSDGPLATIFSQIEDAEEDHRDDLQVQIVNPVGEPVLHTSDSSDGSSILDVPLACASHHERGPPTFCL